MSEGDVSLSAVVQNDIPKHQGADTRTGHWAGCGAKLGDIHDGWGDI